MLDSESGAMVRLFLRSTKGATSIEYAFIASLIAVVIVGGLSATGTRLKAVFTSVSSGFR